MLLKLYGGQQFNPLWYSPALWLDASDASTLIMDGARTFNAASNQYFSCASNPTLSVGNNDMFVGGWWKFNTLPTTIPISKNDFSTNGKKEWEVAFTTGTKIPTFGVSSDGTTWPTTSVSSGVTVTTGTWYFICFYHDSVNDIIAISINGNSFVTTPHSGGIYQGTDAFRIGARFNSGVVNSPLDGVADSVVFCKPANGWLASNATALRDYLYNGGSGRRSSDFISSAYYTGGNPSGAVSWWDMDARSGNETDRIGSNNLTDNGGVGYAAGVASGLVQYTGDPVKQWSDKSGNARHVTAASDAGRPTYTTAAQNGLPSVTFDGVDDYLASGFVFDLATAKTLTIVQVARSAGSGYWSVFQRTGLQDYTSGLYSQFSSGNQDLVLGRGDGGTTNQRSYRYATTVTSSFVQSTRISTSAVDIRKNGVSQSLTNPITNITLANWLSQGSGSHRYLIGCRCTVASNTPDFFSPIVSSELIVFPTVLDDSQLLNVERFAGNKWGITVS